MTESAHVAEYMKIRRYVLSLALKAKDKSVQIPTTIELSKKFGVSRQTVGKAMRQLTQDGFIIGKPGIGSFTNPKRIETTPCTGKLPTIGVIISDGMLTHLDEYHAKNLSAILKIIPEIPSHIRLLNLTSSNPDIILKDLLNEQLDGLIWINPRTFHEPVIRQLRDRHFPLVLHTGNAPDGTNSAEFDFAQAGSECARLLLDENRTGIVFLGDTPPWNAPADGIRKTFREAGIPLNEKLFLPRTSELLDQFRTLLKFGFPIQAVYNAVYLYTEVRDLLNEFNVRVPQDCILIENNLAAAHDPDFHGIVLSPDFERLAREEQRILRNLLENQSAPPETVRIPIVCSIQP